MDNPEIESKIKMQFGRSLLQIGNINFKNTLQKTQAYNKVNTIEVF